MKFLLIILVALGAGWWWTHRDASTQPAAGASTAAAQPSAGHPAAATSTAGTAPADGASWPKRQIDRAQAAADAAKRQHEGL